MIKTLIKNILKFSLKKHSIERIINFFSYLYFDDEYKLNRNHIFPGLVFYTQNNLVKNNYLFNLSIKSIGYAYKNKIYGFNQKLKSSNFYNIYPGEHYRLLKAITKIKKPKTIVEIGTYHGMSTYAFFQDFKGKFFSFDIVSHKKFQSHITKKIEKTFVQHIVDLSLANNWNKFQKIFNQADIIFLDGPKDGIFEYKLLKLISKLKKKKNKILLIDDIKFLNMTNLWDSIVSPKIDLTSFSHYSGTGIVDISKSLKLKN